MNVDEKPAVAVGVRQSVGRRPGRFVALLGPAFVAAIAYVDPGNVAANVSAGSGYGFLLVWVLVLASAMAVMIQYQSAKLGLVTGKSLPQVLGERLSKRSRIAFWAQAEFVAAATDLAEVIGGAIALQLLFGLPLVVGGLIVGVVSMVVLSIQSVRRQRAFETVIMGLLGIIVVGFLAGLVIDPPSPVAVMGGLVPRFAGTETVLLAASMLGATVMPHAIYLHSTLTVDRFGRVESHRLKRLVRATRWDVGLALSVAGAVNIALLLLAAQSLRGKPGTDTIEGAHHAVSEALGPAVAVAFAVGLLASGLASTSVGCYAGDAIMKGMLRRSVPKLLRRAITLIPALLILWAGIDPTKALVISQVVLSFGIPFALIPLQRFTSQGSTMGEFRDGRLLMWLSRISATVIVVLNIVLIYLTVTGGS